MSSQTKPDRPMPPTHGEGVRIYTLEVALLGGFMTEAFAEANPMILRTFVIPGGQTLGDFHRAIFEAFDRFDEQPYEFQFGTEPMDPGADRYVMSEADDSISINRLAAGLAPRTTLDDLGLATGKVFFYWFDFDDDWWHSIQVKSIDLGKPEGESPRVVARVGASPPQYPHLEDEGGFGEADGPKPTNHGPGNADDPGPRS